jgi:S1-C subfamily serine protease
MSSTGLARLLLGFSLAACLAACTTPSVSNLDALNRATVLIEHAKGHGTGTIVGRNQVLTAYHVVADASVDVTFFDGPEVGGRVHWYDEALDLALVEVEVPRQYRATTLACEDLRIGQHLVAVGHPMRARWVAADGRLPTVTAVGGVGLVPLGFEIGLGTSGAPVFDDSGRVAGVALAILAERRSASAVYDEYKETGMGLMLPAAAFCDALTIRSARSSPRGTGAG